MFPVITKSEINTKRRYIVKNEVHFLFTSQLQSHFPQEAGVDGILFVFLQNLCAFSQFPLKSRKAARFI